MQRFARVGLALALLAVSASCGGDGGTGPVPEVVITSISPDVLTPGVVATIEGSGFSSTSSENSVTVAGREVTVISASETVLEVQLPESGFPCASAEGAEVVVQVAEKQDSRLHPIEGGVERTLALGEHIVLPDGAGCNVLTEPGRYLLSVFNAATSPAATSSFALVGSASGTIASALGADTRPHHTSTTGGGAVLRPAGDGHSVALRRSLELVERLGVPRHEPRSEPAPDGTDRTALGDAPPVGTMRSFRIPDLDASSPCSTYHTVSARVVYAGTRGVIWEDVEAPLAGDLQMNATWTDVGEEFDNVMYPVLLEYFGDPLIYDDQLDNDDRVFMLFSPKVNEFTTRTIAGFVYSGDLFPRSGPNSCAASDTAEIFYGVVPNSADIGFGNPEDDEITREYWYWTMRSTVMHEVKHIVSFTHRFANSATTLEEEWLEEATARVAEELYAREVFGYGENGNVTYEESVYCEVRPNHTSAPHCAGLPYTMAKAFFPLRDYYSNMETLTPIGRTNEDDSNFYASGWLLVRWALDQASSSEQQFLQDLTSATSLSGIDNLVTRAGVSYPEMLALFSLSLPLDDRPGLLFSPDQDLTLPGWHVRDVFAGITSDFPQDYPDPFPLHVRTVSSGTFDVTVPELRGGTASLFDLSGFLEGEQSVSIESSTGGAPSSSLGLAIVRIQ